MKKLLLSVAPLVLMTGAAVAADLPSRKAAPILPPPPPAPMWTGFYAGLNAGYGWGTNDSPNSSALGAGNWSVTTTRFLPPPTTTFVDGNSLPGIVASGNAESMTQSGFIGGGQFGYNLQIHQNYVIGFEADIQGAAFRGGSTGYGVLGGSSTFGTPTAGIFAVQNGAVSTAVSAGLDYLGTARGRIGYLVRPDLLVYGTGGLAYGGAWANVATTGASTTTPYAYQTNAPTAPYPGTTQSYLGGGRSNSLLVGYSAGGGIEWMFMPNWSLKTEALYYNLGSMNVSTAAVAAPAYGQILNNAPLAIAQAYSGAGAIFGRNSVNFQGVIARAGVNHHFNFGASPAIARF